MKRSTRRLIGVISDTHGLLRPEAIHALRGVERIIHAGDIGGAQIIETLETIAPVSVVRGNNDRDAWGETLPESITLDIDRRRIYVLHNVAELNLDPAREDISVVISGHSHQPSVTQHGEILFLNPGSAGPRRFTLPTTLAHLLVGPDILQATIVPLNIVPSGRTSAKKTRRKQ
jgi:putative phosphoesterase